jgi:hypothetical protein
MVLVPRMVRFGPVMISWVLPAEIKSPIAVAYWRLNGECVFVTQCEVVFVMGDHRTVVPAGYVFDGASIPRMFWWIPGFSPMGIHLWAALVHDYLCDNPEHADRVMADALFYTILKHSGVGFWRRKAMHFGVRGWAWTKAICGRG